MILGVIGWIIVGVIIGFIATKFVNLRGDHRRRGRRRHRRRGALQHHRGDLRYRLESVEQQLRLPHRVAA